MSVIPGTRLGPYEVTAKIGEGGMGEVYQARDTKLDRDVALKVLPEAFTSDPDRLARFEREAKVLASLNHPNIGSIYGLEEAEGVRALVLELVEGPTLADRIKQGPIPLDEALPIAKQIAEALEAAHEQGVIHRDLKPVNIKVKEDGTVKVLDFGLAKALAGEAGSDPAESPTLTAAATQQGVILGTAAYMSPEQARGKPVDRRSDIWAFGAVLYEMLTGQRPFEGRDVSEVLGGVLRLDPDWDRLPADTSPRLSTLLRRCLEKEQRQRVQAVGDVRLAMEGAFETSVTERAEAAVAPPLQTWQRPVPVALIALFVAVVSSLAVWSLMRPGPQLVARFPIPLSSDHVFSTPNRRLVVISPDGTNVVYTANNSLWLRPVDQLQAVHVRGTDGASGPFFSPDSQSIGFWVDGQLMKVAVTGGAPVTLADVTENPDGATWGTDDMILYGHAEGVLRVSGASGTPEVLISLEEPEAAHGPQMLPGGEWVLFTLRSAGAGSWNSAQIVVQSVTTKERIVLFPGRDARYLSTGHLVYGLNNVILAVPFDVDSREVTGGPVPLVEEVREAGISGGAAQFGVSADGTLVYATGARPPAVGGPVTLVWVDRQGTVDEVPLSPDAYVYPRFSPDGTRMAVQIDAGDDSNIFIYEMSSNRLRQLTFDGGAVPLWTPDGTQITFLAGDALWNIASDFSEEPQLLSIASAEARIAGPYSWSPNGRVLFFEGRWNGVRGVTQLTLLEQGEVEHGPLLVESYVERNANFSGDGTWFSYATTETGTMEVYVQPYPLGSGAKRRITRGGGFNPVWPRNGRELFYMNDGQLWALGIETEATLTWRDPVALFETPWRTTAGAFVNYDVTSDGQRFVFVQPPAGGGATEPSQINVVLNWTQELLDRVAIP